LKKKQGKLQILGIRNFLITLFVVFN